MTQLVHFYQTGTFTAGNRLLDPEDRQFSRQWSGLTLLLPDIALARAVVRLWALVMQLMRPCVQ